MLRCFHPELLLHQPRNVVDLGEHKIQKYDKRVRVQCGGPNLDLQYKSVLHHVLVRTNRPGAVVSVGIFRATLTALTVDLFHDRGIIVDSADTLGRWLLPVLHQMRI